MTSTSKLLDTSQKLREVMVKVRKLIHEENPEARDAALREYFQDLLEGANLSPVNRSLREQEAAPILGKSVQTLRNERHLRKGCAYIKCGRSVRYMLEDIFDYLERHKIDPEAA